MEEEEDSAPDAPAPKKCFTVVQQRRFWSFPPDGTALTLCPSMDLIAYGLPPPQTQTSGDSDAASASASSSLQIYRTLHWQKIAHVQSSPSSLQNDIAVSSASLGVIRELVAAYPVESLVYVWSKKKRSSPPHSLQKIN